METQKIIILAIVTLLSIAVSLTIQQYFLKKARAQLDKNIINLALAIVYAFTIVGFFVLNIKAIFVLEEYIDIIFKVTETEGLPTIAKTSAVFIAIINLWMIINFFFTRILMIVFYGKRNRPIEIANNNYPYFLLEGTILIGMIGSLLPIFEIILHIFFPVEVPFYR